MALFVIPGHVLFYQGLLVFGSFLGYLIVMRVLGEELGVKHLDRVSGAEDVFHPCCDYSVTSTALSQLLRSSHHLTRISVDDGYAEESLVL